MIYPKNRPNQTFGYWLITPNQQFALKLVSFDRRQLQNNCFNGTMLLTMNHVINLVTLQAKKHSYELI